jgi:hypothetical protein
MRCDHVCCHILCGAVEPQAPQMILGIFQLFGSILTGIAEVLYTEKDQIQTQCNIHGRHTRHMGQGSDVDLNI